MYVLLPKISTTINELTEGPRMSNYDFCTCARAHDDDDNVHENVVISIPAAAPIKTMLSKWCLRPSRI